MRPPWSVPPRHMGNGSDSGAYWRASMGAAAVAGGGRGSAGRLGFRVRALVDALKEQRREVALAGIREHREDHRTGRGLGCDLQRRRERAARRNAAENAFLLRQG